jgi:DNA-binding PadR family transcriptional regulator
MATISNKEAALLGLICEKPKHAYEVESDIKERDMRYWTEISMSSVYKLLNKLEDRDFLKSEMKLSERNVNQKVYSITEEGMSQFKQKLMEMLSTLEPIVNPIDVGLSNMYLLNRDKALNMLDKYSLALDKMIKCYHELEDYLVKSGCNYPNVQLATRRIFMLEGEKKWILKFMEGLKNE